MSEACRKLVVCDKVVPCKSAFKQRGSKRPNHGCWKPTNQNRFQRCSSYMLVGLRVVAKRTAVGDWRLGNQLSGSHLQNRVNSISQSMMLSTVLFRTTYTLTRTIIQVELLWILLGLNHLLSFRIARILETNSLITVKWLPQVKTSLLHVCFISQVLSLRQADLSTLTSGYVINLIASDLQRFDLTVLSFVLLTQALFEILSVSIFMFYLFGWKPLTGVMFLLTLTIYYGVMGRVCTALRSKISKVADHRVNIMNSIIAGIRTVKMYAWEYPFMERILRIRR